VGGVELRAAAAGTDDEPGVATGSLMFGHFAVFNEWYAVDSYFEGTFLESFKKGAFTQTFKDDAASIRSIYNHGWDEQLGMKPLGPVQTLREDDVGAYYEVPLLDTHYNRDYVLPALQGRLITGEKVGSQLGASFRFDAIEEQWNTKPTPSDVNPEGLPERTITRAKVLEFGPGMFAISPTATAGVRSTTDIWFDHLRKDPRFTARATERFGVTVVEKLLATKPPDRRTRRGPAAPARTATEPPDGRAKRVDQLQRRARAALLET
jgi:HK97 family phage prohead protease